MDGKIALEEHFSTQMNNSLWDSSGEAGRNGRKNITGQILPGCGHDLSAPIVPTTAREYVGPDGLLYSLGGTARSVWYGQRATWLAVLKSIGAQD